MKKDQLLSLIGNMIPYMNHTGECLAGSNRCVCGHRDNNHFKWHPFACAHCKCMNFKHLDCICGFEKLQNEIVELFK